MKNSNEKCQFKQNAHVKRYIAKRIVIDSRDHTRDFYTHWTYMRQLKALFKRKQAQCKMDLPDDIYRMEMKKEIKKNL